MRSEIIRKCVHCFGCVAAVAAAWLPLWLVVSGSAAVVLLYLAGEARRMRGRTLPPITTVTELCSRREESRRPALGPVALAFGFVGAFVVFTPEIARAAFVISCIADSVAALVGQRIGRHAIPFSRKKTCEGSVGGFVCALPFGLVCTGPWRALAATAAVAVAEMLPLGDLDNLLLPFVAGCVLTLPLG